MFNVIAYTDRATFHLLWFCAHAYLWRTDWRSRSPCVWNARLLRCCRRTAGSWLRAPWRSSQSCSSPPNCCSSAKILNVYEKKRSPQGGYTSRTCWERLLFFIFFFNFTRPILIILLSHFWLLSPLFLRGIYTVLSLSLSLFLWERGPIRHREFYLWAEGPVGGWARWHQHQTPVKQKQIVVM